MSIEGGSDRRDATPTQVIRSLRAAFEEFGLSNKEARVLVAVLQLGPATANQLYTSAEVPRTGIYPCLEELTARGLVQTLPGKSALWVSVGPEDVLNRLFTAQEERHSRLRSTLGTARELLDHLSSEAATVATSYVQLIHGPTHASRTYDMILARTQFELRVFTKPPYSSDPTANPVILEALERGVNMRVVYDSNGFEPGHAEAFGVYHEAGVQGRVVHDLPIKLVISDRRSALLALPDMIEPENGFPTVQLIEHRGYADVLISAFEQYWKAATPISEMVFASLSRSEPEDPAARLSSTSSRRG